MSFILRRSLVLAIVAAIPSILVIREPRAQETFVDEPAMSGADGMGSGCGRPDVRQPPWHGNVAGEACGPACPACGVFHADPCGQLHPRRNLHPCVTLPSWFPRLHTWCTEGYFPTPKPLALPRCHNCGAFIEGGL